MPLVRLLVPVADLESAAGTGGDIRQVDGDTASRLVSEGRAVLVRDVPPERASEAT